MNVLFHRSIPSYLTWISYLSWFRYAEEALMINQWEGVENINCTSTTSNTCPTTGHIVLDIYGFKEVCLIDCFLLILITFIIISFKGKFVLGYNLLVWSNMFI